MPLDPTGLLGYSLMGAGSGLVNRLMQRYLPTPLEKAQLSSLYDNLAHARERLASEEQRFAVDLGLRRELHLKALQANADLAQDQDLMRRWPLGTPAAAIVRASQKNQSAALNLIILPVVRPMEATDLEAEKTRWQDLSLAIDATEELAQSLFGTSAICYREWSHPKNYISGQPAQTAPNYPSGQALNSVIYSLIQTEPTVLIQASFSAEDQLRLSWACWGWLGDEGEPEPGTTFVNLSASGAHRRAELKSALLSVACLMADAFHLARLPSRISGPFFPSAILKLAPVTFNDDMSQPAKAITARDLLVESYLLSLRQVAVVAPALASEASARAALSLLHADLPNEAETFTAQALAFVRDGLNAPSIAEEKIIKQVFARRATPQLEIRKALQQVRNVDPIKYLEAPIDMSLDDILARLDEAEGLDPKARKAMKEKLLEMVNFVPKIGVFGKAGVGKSSLCNALFGADVCAVDDIEACTREPKDVLVELGKDKRLTLIDVPGVGESRERDDEYRKLYKSLLPELDILLWVIKIDDRSHSIDQNFYETVVLPEIKGKMVVLFVLNQADKIEPFREWNLEKNEPGPNQVENIKRKITVIKDLFKVKASQVVPVSATESFFLTELVDKIVMSLPRSKRLAPLRAVRSEHRSLETVNEVEKDVENELNGAAIATGAVIGGAIGIFGGPVGIALGAAVGAFIGGWLGRR